MTLDLNKSDKELQNDLQEAEEKNRKNKIHVKRVLSVLFTVSIIGVGTVITFLIYAAYQRSLSYERMNTGGTEATAIMDNEFVEHHFNDGTISYDITYHFKAS